MPQIRSVVALILKRLPLALFLAGAAVSFVTQADVKICHELLAPQPEVKLRTIFGVQYSEQVIKANEPELLQRLRRALLFKPLYVIKEPLDPLLSKALVASLVSPSPIPLLNEIRFREISPGIIKIFDVPEMSKKRALWFYQSIADATLPQKDHALPIARGYLEGFNLVVHPKTVIKLVIKHQLSLAVVMAAFSKWREGPVRIVPIELPVKSEEPSIIRYYFVIEQGQKIVKVIFDWRPKDHLVKDDEPSITLVTAYPVPQNELDDFLAASKELE